MKGRIKHFPDLKTTIQFSYMYLKLWKSIPLLPEIGLFDLPPKRDVYICLVITWSHSSNIAYLLSTMIAEIENRLQSIGQINEGFE